MIVSFYIITQGLYIKKVIRANAWSSAGLFLRSKVFIKKSIKKLQQIEYETIFILKFRLFIFIFNI